MSKTAIITGASGGIGATVARILAADHNIVAGYCTAEDKARRLVDELTAGGAAAIACQADVTSTEQVDALVDSAVTAFGGVDVLVNCAGTALFSLAQETDDRQYQRVMEINMGGVFRACRAALPQMIARKNGAIVNISSMWGLAGASCETVYSASKAAVIGFTKALAKEVAPSGIRVNCVAPGLVDTGMNRTLSAQAVEAFVSETPLVRIGSPEDVARAVRYLVDDAFTTGQVLSPNGGAVI